jgi:hypothetical protein
LRLFLSFIPVSSKEIGIMGVKEEEWNREQRTIEVNKRGKWA